MAKLRRRTKSKKFRIRHVPHQFPRMLGISKLWTEWSYTKMCLLRSCSLQWHFRYVERRSAPKWTLLVAGAALHAMGQSFFRVRYQSAESFIKAWRFHWLNMADGNWGPNGRFDPPIEIAWEYPAERFVWLNKGVKVLKAFYDRHADHRGTGIGRATEVGFRFPWRNFVLNGKIDRIDEFEDHVEIIDYKLGGHKPYQLSEFGSDQATIYRLGYEHDLFPSFGGKPLTKIRVESLNSGEIQDFETRSEAAENRLHEIIGTNAWYVQSLYGRPDIRAKPKIEVQPFPTKANGEYILWPKLPRDYGHCGPCPFHQPCLDFEAHYRRLHQAPDPMAIHQEWKFSRWRAEMPTQLIMLDEQT